MTVIGESAITSPSGMSLVSTETQLPATDSIIAYWAFRRSVQAGIQCVTVFRWDP